MIYAAIVVLTMLAAVYILWPLRAASVNIDYCNIEYSNDAQESHPNDEHLQETLSQLDMERSLGKINEEEYQSSRAMITMTSPLSPVEDSTIQTTEDDSESDEIEAEILIARARRKRQVQQPVIQQWTCASCSREMSMGDKFCASCGAAQPQAVAGAPAGA